MGLVRAEDAFLNLVPGITRSQATAMASRMGLQGSFVDAGLLVGAGASANFVSTDLLFNTRSGKWEFGFKLNGEQIPFELSTNGSLRNTGVGIQGDIFKGQNGRNSSKFNFSLNAEGAFQGGLAQNIGRRLGVNVIVVKQNGELRYRLEVGAAVGLSPKVGVEAVVATPTSIIEGLVQGSIKVAGLEVFNSAKLFDGGASGADALFRSRIDEAARRVGEIATTPNSEGELNLKVAPIAIAKLAPLLEGADEILLSEIGNMLIDGAEFDRFGDATGRFREDVRVNPDGISFVSPTSAESEFDLFDRLHPAVRDRVKNGNQDLFEKEDDFVQKNLECFAPNTMVRLVNGQNTSIKNVKIGDEILAFSSSTGRIEPARITQIHKTPDQPVIDFHGTRVTPGHVFAQPDEAWREIGAILLADAFVVNEDGEIIRARTGDVVSPETFALLQATIGPSGVPAFEVAAGRMASPSQTAPEDRPQKSLYLPGVTTIGGENDLNNTNSLLFAKSGAGLSTEGGAHGTLTLDPGRQGSGRPFDPWDFTRPAPDGYTLPWAGRETVYNITVEGLHTYIADGWRVHNDSREFRQAGTALGGLLADQLFAHFGNDNVALDLAA